MIYGNLGIKESLTKFMKRYYHATKEDHGWLDINIKYKRMRAGTTLEYVPVDEVETS